MEAADHRLQDLQEIVVRVPLVQEHGQLALGRELELCLESCPLRFARREIAEIVEAAFSDRDDLRLPQQGAERRLGGLVPVGGMVRVHPGGGKEGARPRLRQLGSLLAAGHGTAGDDQARHAALGRTLDDLVTIGVERIVGQIGADIDEVPQRLLSLL